MTREEKKAIIEQKAVGYWTDFGGVEVKNFEYGIEDYLTCVSFASTDTPKVHYLKIKCTRGGRFYVIVYGHQLYLDECLAIRR